MALKLRRSVLCVSLVVLLSLAIFALPVMAASDNIQDTLILLEALQKAPVEPGSDDDIADNVAAVESLLDAYLRCDSDEKAAFTPAQSTDLRAYFEGLYRVQDKDLSTIDNFFVDTAAENGAESGATDISAPLLDAPQQTTFNPQLPFNISFLENASLGPSLMLLLAVMLIVVFIRYISALDDAVRYKKRQERILAVPDEPEPELEPEKVPLVTAAAEAAPTAPKTAAEIHFEPAPEDDEETKKEEKEKPHEPVKKPAEPRKKPAAPRAIPTKPPKPVAEPRKVADKKVIPWQPPKKDPFKDPAIQKQLQQQEERPRHAEPEKPAKAKGTIDELVPRPIEVIETPPSQKEMRRVEDSLAQATLDKSRRLGPATVRTGRPKRMPFSQGAADDLASIDD